VLRRIFGPKREEVTRGWRKFDSEELLLASQEGLCFKEFS
jgi:hypothetical protein